MPLLKEVLNEAERCVPEIITVIMEVLNEPSGEMHFVSMSSEIALRTCPNIWLPCAGNRRSGGGGGEVKPPSLYSFLSCVRDDTSLDRGQKSSSFDSVFFFLLATLVVLYRSL